MLFAYSIQYFVSAPGARIPKVRVHIYTHRVQLCTMPNAQCSPNSIAVFHNSQALNAAFSQNCDSPFFSPPSSASGISIIIVVVIVVGGGGVVIVVFTNHNFSRKTGKSWSMTMKFHFSLILKTHSQSHLKPRTIAESKQKMQTQVFRLVCDRQTSNVT